MEFNWRVIQTKKGGYHKENTIIEDMEFKNTMKPEFKVYSPLTNKSVDNFITKNNGDADDGERILLEGIASTTNRDLHDEIVALSAIESMAEQATNLNIHGDHFYNLEDTIGAIKEATVEDKQLRIKFLITKKHTPYIIDLLETGVKLGLSIGGYVTSYDEKNRIINAINLHEISLTAMPANWDTFGTVTSNKGLVESTCITGACHAIVKKIESENMDKPIEEPTNPQEEEDVVGLTEEKVIELINEYMAEKEETIAQEITDKVTSQLETIVEAKVQELIKPDEETPEEEAETKAETEEETEDEEKEEETKSFDPSMISEEISKGIAAALGEGFVDQVASKMFGELDKQRTNNGSKFEEYQKSLESEPVDEPVVKTTYSTAETAKILMEKQASANPLQAAIMKNLK